MLDRERILSASRSELRTLMQQGFPVTPDDIADHSYRGISLGLHPIIERVTWKTFRKSFVRDRRTDDVRGYNVRLQQTGIDGPSIPRTKRGAPWIFGHFNVRPASADEVPNGGVMLDYGVPANRFSPIGKLRDPLVALEADSFDALLGCSLLAIAGKRIKTPSFFLLEREPASAI